MFESSQYETSAEAVERPTRASEHDKNIFVTLSTAGSLLGLIVAIVANAWLR